MSPHWSSERSASCGLPICDVLPEFLHHFRRGNVVLEAPPGAGKTTVVPLAVLEGTVSGTILVLQPRRIACLTAARRLSELWGEPVGETIGYRMRHESVVGNGTRLEVITEGVLLRMLHCTGLQGVDAIFFDEFHERNLDSDMGLAVCISLQRGSKNGLKIVVMSATLGSLGTRLSRLLDCPLVSSSGRCFNVEVRHVGSMHDSSASRALETRIANIVVAALDRDPGDVLVFLPGEQEIMFVWIFLHNLGIGDGRRPTRLVRWAHRLIKDVKLDRRVRVCPLYGALDQEDQDRVLFPLAGWRTVILATHIAESSLTVPGTRIVVDCGLRRTKFSDANSMSRMCTIPISIASAEQRRGRAGREDTGVCYRLWSAEEHNSLEEHDEPEVQREDFTSCFLNLIAAGCRSYNDMLCFPWLDPPLETHLSSACAVLERMRAIEPSTSCSWRLTHRGRQIAKLPLHPRLGHMISQAYDVSRSLGREACVLAAVLSEKEILRGGRSVHGVDLHIRLSSLAEAPSNSHSKSNQDTFILEGVKKRVFDALRQLEETMDKPHAAVTTGFGERQRSTTAVLVAWAFPELFGRACSSKDGRFVLHNGNIVKLSRTDKLSQCPFLAIAAISDDKIFLAVEAMPMTLASFGISVKNPVCHTVFSNVSRQDHKEPRVQQAVECHDTTPATLHDPVVVKDSPKKQLCPGFESGCCFAGTSCEFAHGAPELLHSIHRFQQAFTHEELLTLTFNPCQIGDATTGVVGRTPVPRARARTRSHGRGIGWFRSCVRFSARVQPMCVWRDRPRCRTASAQTSFG